MWVEFLRWLGYYIVLLNNRVLPHYVMGLLGGKAFGRWYDLMWCGLCGKWYGVENTDMHVKVRKKGVCILCRYHWIDTRWMDGNEEKLWPRCWETNYDIQRRRLNTPTCERRHCFWGFYVHQRQKLCGVGRHHVWYKYHETL